MTLPLILGLLWLSVPGFIAWQSRSSTLQCAAARIAKLQPPDGYFALAPDERWILHSSQEGKVEIERQNGDFTVLFVTGVTDFSGDLGFVYSQRDMRPNGSLQRRGYLEAVSRVQPHWFRCISPNGWD